VKYKGNFSRKSLIGENILARKRPKEMIDRCVSRNKVYAWVRFYCEQNIEQERGGEGQSEVRK